VQDQSIKYLYYNKNKNVNIKITKQDYETKSYFKLFLNKLKVIGVPFGDLSQTRFHGGFLCVHQLGKLLKILPNHNHKWTKNQLWVNLELIKNELKID